MVESELESWYKSKILTIYQATAETVNLDAPHAPKEESIKAFDSILPDLKKDLVHMRKERQSTSPETLLVCS